jgi:hypothetical protein
MDKNDLNLSRVLPRMSRSQKTTEEKRPEADFSRGDFNRE